MMAATGTEGLDGRLARPFGSTQVVSERALLPRSRTTAW
jgi:hypothetical protein